MIKGLFTSSSNLHSKVQNMDIVANNLANLNTTGFKRELPFSEIIARFNNENIKQLTDFTQGTLLSTNNPLDLALSGNVFFTLETPDGTEYTKKGQFQLNDEGYLVNEQGYKVLGESGPINLSGVELDEDNKVTVSKSGVIKIGDKIVDELQVVKLDESQSLIRKKGLNFDTENGTYIEAEKETYEVQQGFIEESNVNPVLEMQAMININKEFESTQKVISSIDQSLAKVVDAGNV
jgi:flagellar basal-body rod protein FlgF